MAVAKPQKEEIVKKFRQNDLDTGSSEVQIALLTARINQLTTHFVSHDKDHHGKRGLVRIVNTRRKLLDYLKRTDHARYEKVLRALDIRK
ncbi:MAG: 30S ribosomal protein S15 [Bdellovibrionota bacterium]